MTLTFPPSRTRQSDEPNQPRKPAGGDRRPRSRPPADGRRAVRAIWISDLHLGTRGARTGELLEFLKAHRPERLYLVGDILDGWVLSKGWHWDEGHERVVDEVLSLVAQGTRVTWVAGNHDEFLRRYLGMTVGGIRVVDEAVHRLRDGRRLLVVHGDAFDATLQQAPWLAHLGDVLYRLALWLNGGLARVRAALGLPYWSLSRWLKARVKGAVGYVTSFEDTVLDHVRELGLDGVVCGHVHTACLREQDGLLYANDGDWVESCTALVESLAGELELVEWLEVRAGGAAAAI